MLILRLVLTALLSVALPPLAAWPAYADDFEVKLESITSPARPGDTVVIVISAIPGATCSGHRQPHAGLDIPIPPQVAGADGKVSWSWEVVKVQNPVGLRSVHIACTFEKRQGTMDTSFAVAF